VKQTESDKEFTVRKLKEKIEAWKVKYEHDLNAT
jgi:hypothetical protein